MKNKIFFLLFILLFCVGFRWNYHKWNISNSSEAESKVFVSYNLGNTEIKNDVELGDVLYEAASELTVDVIMQTIFDDFNSISGSYLKVVNISDSDFTEYGFEKKITLDFSGASGLAIGEAKVEVKGRRAIKCEIALEKDSLESAKGFIGIVTHELGHCFGLGHPQETVNAVMSYFAENQAYRLQIDDKMGILYQYPINKSAAKESNTWGMSCAKRN